MNAGQISRICGDRIGGGDSVVLGAIACELGRASPPEGWSASAAVRSLTVGGDARIDWHTCCIRARGGDLAATQKALGHASIRTTIDVYTHLQVSDVAGAVEAMEKAREETASGQFASS
jgi:hypothetical protein